MGRSQRDGTEALSPCSDPAAQWIRRSQRACLLCLTPTTYLIDLPRAAIIVDVEATRAIRQAEVGA